jgi:hypothetical protein
MAVTTAGVYLAFDGGPDASSPDGHGIGPYEEIVLRGARAVGERGGFGKVIALRSAAGSWRDAETSAAESNQVETGRGDLRVRADHGGVVVRFGDDDVIGAAAVPDLGPFAVVVVGTYDVRGDEETLAVRVSRISHWQLTDKAGASFQGTLKDALVFAAAGRATPSQPRRSAETSARAPAETKNAEVREPDRPNVPAASEDDAPSVWVDRAKAAPNIYISRPDRKR